MKATKPSKPSKTPHHVVRSLTVTGGFLKGLKLDLVDGLNCFIGGRGAGKTTALEFLRFGLGLMPDQKTANARFRTIDTLVKANLGSGRLSIDFETKNDMRYTASRGANESVQLVNEAGQAVAATLDRDLIFSAEVYSQHEIEEIAMSPASQLTILDRFAEDESLAIARDLQSLMQKLAQSSEALSRVDEEIDDLRMKASEVPILEERLKGFADVGGPDAARINAGHSAKASRAKEEKVPALLSAAIQRTTREIRASAAALTASVDAHVDSAVRDGENKNVFQAIDEGMRQLVKVTSAAAEAVATAAAVAETLVTTQASLLAAQHAAQEATYRTILAESEEQGGRIAERAALQTALASAASAAKEQHARETARHALAKERAELLNRVSELKDRRYQNRKRIAEELTARFTTIRVSIAQAEDLERFRQALAEALKGRGVQHNPVAEHLAEIFLPSELSAVVLKNNHQPLVDKAGFEDERARKILMALRASGCAYSIECVDLEDRPSIELKDGETYKESPALSTGQRCTTILPILMLQSERPLLIDQPEDNLDNQFVFHTVVKALREVKGSRQVVFVTHNPNIPVLGDAERVFVFSSDGEHATVVESGTVDECKKAIENILEGGPDAFRERKKRYGY